jgi:hypothetical protein
MPFRYEVRHKLGRHHGRSSGEPHARAPDRDLWNRNGPGAAAKSNMLVNSTRRCSQRFFAKKEGIDIPA